MRTGTLVYPRFKVPQILEALGLAYQDRLKIQLDAHRSSPDDAYCRGMLVVDAFADDASRALVDTGDMLC